MAEVRLSPQARLDLNDIRAEGVERFGEIVAERHLVGLRDTLSLLSRHPLAGQARPEFRQDVRFIPHKPHRILYSVPGEVVLIIRVIHQARDVRSALAASR